MFNTIREFCETNKDSIKNVALVVTGTVAVVGCIALYGVNKLNKFIDEKGLTEEYYSDPDEIETEA